MSKRTARYMFKMVSLGDAATGKTSCIIRYTENSFGESYQATMGTNIAVKNLQIELTRDETVPVQIVLWDLGGQPDFKELRLRYMAGASIAFIVYDVTNPRSFLHVYDWYSNFMSVNPDAAVALVANKIDLEERRVPPEAGQMLSEWLDVIHVETSAKTGENVETLFTDLITFGVRKHSSRAIE
ncbi:MAG: Rab family GTPase [Candidatus Thorarchaeota archaeon]